jgi:alkylhydroperoxidase/carboxymuconolactone decarboxylase family protein YurZ
MTTPAGPAFMAKLTKNDHHMAEHVNEIREHIVSDGALSAKVKTLMTLVCDAITAHEDGCRNIANRARALGATEEEIAETVQVAFLFGGMPALVTACAAFKDD